MKTKIAAAASPGSASGSATLQNAEKPAAAERHRRLLELAEMPAKTLAVMSTANGSASAVCASATPSTESSIPQRMNVTASGIDEDHDREGARADDREPERVRAAEREAGERVAGGRADRRARGRA